MKKSVFNSKIIRHACYHLDNQKIRAMEVAATEIGGTRLA